MIRFLFCVCSCTVDSNNFCGFHKNLRKVPEAVAADGKHTGWCDGRGANPDKIKFGFAHKVEHQ